MNETFLGVPVGLWGGLCIAVALVWVWVWPKDRALPEEGLRYIIVRWFHALVWLLLAAAAFLKGAGIDGAVQPVALASLAAYLVFLIAVFTGSPR